MTRSWWAVRSDSPMAVAELLGLHQVHPASGNDPIWEAACREGSDALFLTEPLDGWVLVIGRWAVGADPVDLRHQLMWTAALAGEAQAFCIDSETGRHHWLRARRDDEPR